MESSSIYVLWSLFIIINSWGIIGSIQIMVIDYYLCGDIGSCKGGTKIIFYEISLGFGREIHAGVISRVQWLILRSNSWYLDPLFTHFLNVFHKIFRIGFIILWLKTAAFCFVVVLHPSWRAPWCRNYCHVGINSQYFLQNWNQIFSIWVNTEFLLFNITLISCEIIITKSFFIQIRRPHTQSQTTDWNFVHSFPE